MKKIDFKKLTQEQEDKLNNLLETMSKSALNSINNLSVPPENITIYSSDKKSLAEIQDNAENMTPEWIEHLKMWFETIETIMRIRGRKKSFWSRLKFW